MNAAQICGASFTRLKYTKFITFTCAHFLNKHTSKFNFSLFVLSHKEEEKKQLACFFWETFNLLAVCFSFFFATSLIFEKMGLLCAKSLAPKRPLIVHFDLNGTVMREKDESLEKTFAKNLFGWTDEQNEWHMNPGE